MGRRRNQEVPIEDFYALKIGAIWRHFKSESFAFWMICGYLFTEYVRPQSIMPALDFLPWAQLFVLLALVGWFFDKNKKWVSSPINKLLILYFGVILISSYTGYFPGMSEAQLANFYTWMIIYFLIINIVNTPKRLLIFLFIFLLASFKISLSLAQTWAMRGFAFTSWGLSGPPGFFKNSGELAIQMAVYWPIALAFCTGFKPYLSKWKYYGMLLMPITAGMVILGSSSRGGQLAMAVQLLTKYFRNILKIKIIIVVAIVAVAGWKLLPEEQKARFSEAGEDRTSQQRLLYWENGWEMMKEHPVFGVGYYNFIPYYERYYPQDMLYEDAELAHNIFIQVGADLGFSGLLIYFLMILIAFRIARRARQDLQDRGEEWRFFSGLAGALNISFLGFLVAGQFVSVVYYPFMWIHLALVVGLECAVKNND